MEASKMCRPAASCIINLDQVLEQPKGGKESWGRERPGKVPKGGALERNTWRKEGVKDRPRYCLEIRV